MNTTILKTLYLTATLLASIALTATAVSAPPTPVAEMSKKELKHYKRDASSVAFDTQINKDRANNLAWVESPVLADPSTPNLRHYIRAAVRDGQLVTIQIIITQLHSGFAEYDRKSMDFTAVKLGDMSLPTEPGEPLRDPANDAITQISAATITEKALRDRAETGLHLLARNSFGQTEVPIKAATVTGYLRRLDGQLKKAK